MEKWQIYAREATTQIEFAKTSWASFIEAESESDIKNIFLFLQHFLTHAANVDKILSPRSNHPRIQFLTRHIDLTGIDLKPFRDLRNHLEHFDERLDKWITNLYGHAFFDMNLVTNASGFPKNAFLRALDGHIYKFQGEDYDLDQLYRSLLAIEQRLPIN